MAFSSILIGTLCLYAVYYAANIIYDLFFVANTSGVRFDTEEEIEISEHENALPTSSYAQAPLYTTTENTSSPYGEEASEFVHVEQDDEPIPTELTEELPLMNGGMDIEELISQVQQAENPSELQFVATSWI